MESSTPPIVILTGRSITSYMLINHLTQQYNVSLIVYEHSKKRKLLRYRIKKLGGWTVFNQLLFMIWDRFVIRPRSKSFIRTLLNNENTSPPNLPSIDVDSVNSAEVQEHLAEIQPQVVVVSGTGIIRKKVLSLAPTFINIHVGITPRYRGVHGGFWAIVEENFDNIGTTIHLIDEGVDTGDILYQDTIEVSPQDTYRTLPVKQYLVGKDLMSKAVADALSDNLQPYNKPDMVSKQWFTPTFKDYFKFIRNLRHFR